jgi:deoxyadenosine/deoxycytidine kinase
LKDAFRIEICGGIASGKTTMASLFDAHAELALEDFTATPFWRPFYETPGFYNFEAELSFLLQHYHQIKRRSLEGGGRDILVCDFSYRLDRAYSTVSLEGREFQAFEGVYKQVLTDSIGPGLLIHLQCTPETQMQRIRARARKVESGITIQFLDSLNAAIEREIALARGSVPIVSIDSETSNFAHDAETKTRYRHQILNRVFELVNSAS